MEKRIKVSDDLRRKLAKLFKVTETTVRSALRYDLKKGQTDTAVKIRVAALQNGGVPCLTLPECETIHDEENGTMVQTFGNGAQLVIDKTDGTAVALYKGRAHKRWENVMVSEIPVMQEYTAGI